MNFNWAKALGFGLLIWAVVFALARILVGLDIRDSIWSSAAVVAVAGLLSYGLARRLHPEHPSQMWWYGLVWVGMSLLLDLLVTSQFNTVVFTAQSQWLSYAAILLAPLLELGIHPIRREAPHARM